MNMAVTAFTIIVFHTFFSVPPDNKQKWFAIQCCYLPPFFFKGESFGSIICWTRFFFHDLLYNDHLVRIFTARFRLLQVLSSCRFLLRFFEILYRLKFSSSRR